MGATIGKNLDTGMTSITFDSTRRTVQFTPEESDDFDQRMMIVKMEGKCSKESIGSKAVYVLKILGEAIAEGDPETIANIWLGQGKPIVEAGVLNNIIETVKIPNPFELFYINDNPESKDYDENKTQNAIKVSQMIQEILDKMIQDISDLEVTSEYEMVEYSKSIIKLRGENVGVGDTTTDESIAEYVKNKLKKIFGVDDALEMSNDFYDLIHLHH